MVCETCIGVDDTQFPQVSETHAVKDHKLEMSKIQQPKGKTFKNVACDADEWSSKRFDDVMEKHAKVVGSHITKTSLGHRAKPSKTRQSKP